MSEIISNENSKDVAEKSETEELVSNTDVEKQIFNPERKGKPPPLDVAGAQGLQQLSVGGPKTPLTASPGQKLKERKIGHRRVDEEGQITFKKIQTSQIMGSIQLGISHAVGSLAHKPERDLLMQDFTIVETIFFPHDGSNNTPAHRYSDFKFKAYAPVAFRYFRDLFGIQKDDFLLSLCNNPLRELTNPGASGSIFYLTDDDEFIIKTVQHKEAEFLQKLLPGYYMNLNQNPRTLLPKFFGLYCYQCGGKNIRLVIMNNLLPSSIRIDEKFDLKGSTYKRKANKQERKKACPTFKDLDFIEKHTEPILLETDTYNALMRTISRDCLVLESFKIMDYSLLVGIHNLNLAKCDKTDQKQKNISDDINRIPEEYESSQVASFNKSGTSLVRSKSMNRQRLAAFSTAMESIQVEIEDVAQDEDVPTGGIPATNSKGDNLLMFLGIIDILQSFRFRKKLEHAWKSVLYDGDTVSVHRPNFYAQRFQDFMGKSVFKDKDKDKEKKILPHMKRSPSKRKSLTLKKQSAISESESSKIHLQKTILKSDVPTLFEEGVPSTSVPLMPSSSKEVSSAVIQETEFESACVSSKIIIDSEQVGDKVASTTMEKTEVVSLSEIDIKLV